jgi:uncharacterized protein
MMLMSLLALLAQAAEPSFDCDKAHNQVEHLICGSTTLSALDREESRLYREILAASPGARARIVARQRQFLRDRDACSASSIGTDICVHDAYLQDITDMRRTWPIGRDVGALSSVPVRYHCDGGYPDAYVTTFDLAPSEVYVSVHTTIDEATILIGDGDHYVGRDNNMDGFDSRAARLQLGRRICTPAQ